MLEENFARIVETDFTADMEEQLVKLKKVKRIGSNYYMNFIHLLKAVEKAERTLKKLKFQVSIDEKCPECKEGDLVIKIGRYGKFIACNRYPECDYTRQIEIVVEDGKCPKCGSGILERLQEKDVLQILCL